MNPAHLVEWTSADNQRDKHQKGRAVIARGERSGGAKITDVQAEYVRSRATEVGYRPGKRGKGGVPGWADEVAAELGISAAQVRRIANRTSRA